MVHGACPVTEGRLSHHGEGGSSQGAGDVTTASWKRARLYLYCTHTQN